MDNHSYSTCDEFSAPPRNPVRYAFARMYLYWEITDDIASLKLSRSLQFMLILRIASF